MDATLQRIHKIFRHNHALFSLKDTQTSLYRQTAISYMLNCALIKLKYLHQHFQSLLSSLYTCTSRVIRRSRTSLHNHIHHLIFRKPYDTYPSPSAEQRYWDSAERGLRQLRQSDARFVGSERPKNVRVPEMPPLVMYYVPALLPRYRDEDGRTKRIKNGYHLEPEDYYGQWHQMVFSDSDYPDDGKPTILIYI